MNAFMFRFDSKSISLPMLLSRSTSVLLVFVVGAEFAVFFFAGFFLAGFALFFFFSFGAGLRTADDFVVFVGGASVFTLGVLKLVLGVALLTVAGVGTLTEVFGASVGVVVGAVFVATEVLAFGLEITLA